MAVNVDVKILDDVIEDEGFIAKEFAFVGFNIVNTASFDGVEFYFYLSDDNETNTYLIKNSFAFSEETMETDLAFLNSPLHDTINLNKLARDDGERLSELLLDIADDKQYYSSFKATSIDDGNIICDAVHRDNEGKQHKISITIPFNIYSMIHILKNQMIYNIPINIFIDQDQSFEHVVLHDECTLKYIGCDTSYSSQVLAFYSLKDNYNTIGLISPIQSLDRMVLSNILTKEQFTELYKTYALINMTKIFFIDWIEDDNPIKKICIYFRDDDCVNIYMIPDKVNECTLMKPYEMVYENKQ